MTSPALVARLDRSKQLDEEDVVPSERAFQRWHRSAVALFAKIH